MAEKTYFVKGFKGEQLESFLEKMDSKLKSKILDIVKYKDQDVSIILKLREIEAINLGLADLREFNETNGSRLYLVGLY